MEEYINYKLAQVRNHLHKAKRILLEVELLNSKIESDFYAIDTFCTYQENILRRGQNEYRVGGDDKG